MGNWVIWSMGPQPIPWRPLGRQGIDSNDLASGQGARAEPEVKANDQVIKVAVASTLDVLQA